RDFHVTGVQTCALPIFWPLPLSPVLGARHRPVRCDIRTMRMLSALEHTTRHGGETSQPYRADEGGSGPLMVYCCDEKKENQTNRSEERRVGKECRTQR